MDLTTLHSHSELRDSSASLTKDQRIQLIASLQNEAMEALSSVNASLQGLAHLIRAIGTTQLDIAKVVEAHDAIVLAATSLMQVAQVPTDLPDRLGTFGVILEAIVKDGKKKYEETLVSWAEGMQVASAEHITL